MMFAGNNSNLLERQRLVARTIASTSKLTFRPSGTVLIEVIVRIMSLGSVNDYTMEMTAQIILQQEWVDPRLANATLFGDLHYVYMASDEPIWSPDTYFINEQHGRFHNVDQPNTFTKVHANGRVQYSKRLTMAVSCPMHLVLYPHDNQTCSIDLSSYRHSDKEISYLWKELQYTVTDVDSLSIFKVISIMNQSFVDFASNKTCLRVNIELQRLFSYFLLQLYIPSCMLVSVSCISFWIDWRCAPARVPLAIVTLLAMTTQSQGINANLPPVSYTKAIDIWVGACIGFIFAALLEYALVNYIGINEEKKKRSKQQTSYTNNFNNSLDAGSKEELPYKHYGTNQFPLPMYPPICKKPPTVIVVNSLRKRRFIPGAWLFSRKSNTKTTVTTSLQAAWQAGRNEDSPLIPATVYTSYSNCSRSPQLARVTRADHIDKISRLLFPVGFCGFNIVYWLIYLPKSSN